MPSQRNIDLLAKTKEKFDRATAAFFVDYQGLTHKQLEEVRRALSEFDSELSIVKNNLVNLALKDQKIEAGEQLQGPIATLFSYSDPIKTAKVLQSFFKKYNLPKIRFGIFEGKIIDESRISKLASIPPREVLLSKLVGLLKSPINNLVYDLNWNIQKFVFVLKAIEDNKKPS